MALDLPDIDLVTIASGRLVADDGEVLSGTMTVTPGFASAVHDPTGQVIFSRPRTFAVSSGTAQGTVMASRQRAMSVRGPDGARQRLDFTYRISFTLTAPSGGSAPSYGPFTVHLPPEVSFVDLDLTAGVAQQAGPPVLSPAVVSVAGLTGAVTVAQLQAAGLGGSTSSGGLTQAQLDAGLATRAPSSHTHPVAQLSDATQAGRTLLTAPTMTAARAAIGAGTSNLAVGTTAGTAAAGNDARLADARTPTGGAGGVLSGSFPNPGFAVAQATKAQLDAAVPPTGTTGHVLTKTAAGSAWASAPAGTGGGSTTVAAAPTGVRDVVAYGAVGDGVTDDLTAVRAAVAALRDGEQLLFPPGRDYLVSDTILVRSLTGLHVEMTGATISCTAETDTSAVLMVENTRHLTVTGGRLRCTVPGVRRNDADGLRLVHCADVLVQGVYVGYVRSMGVRLSGCTRATVTGSTVDGTVADGIGTYPGARGSLTGDASIAAGSTTLTCPSIDFNPMDVGSTIRIDAGVGGAGFFADVAEYLGGDSVRLTAPAPAGVSNYFLTLARHSQDIIFTGNRARGTGDDSFSAVGYRTSANAVPVGPLRRITVTDNVMEDCRARGIVLVGVWQGLVVDNAMDRIQQGGVFISTEPNVGGSWGCQDVEVGTNVVDHANLDYGNGDSNYGSIFVNSSFPDYPVQGINVHHNTIRGGGSYYIGVGSSVGARGTRDIVVEGNRCWGGNGANPGINALNTTNLDVLDNTLELAAAEAVRVADDVDGLVRVWDNVARGHARLGGGQAAYVTPAGARLRDNLTVANTATPTAPTPPPTATPTGPRAGLTGAALWLRSASIAGVADGAALSPWPDASGNARDATQAVPAARPLYRSTAVAEQALAGGKPIVVFDTVDDVLAGVLPALPQPLTVFAVLRDPRPTDGYRPYVDLAGLGQGGDRVVIDNNGAGQLAISAPGRVTSTRTIPVGAVFVVSAVLNGASSRVRLNRTAVTLSGPVGTGGASTATPGYVLGRYADGNFSAGLTHVELLIHPRALTAAEVDAVEAEIAADYAIT